MSKKTRAQKIQSSQRKMSHQETPNPTQTVVTAPAGLNTVSPQHKAASAQTSTGLQNTEFAYVGKDLRHIAWTALFCLILLAIATLLFSDFAAIQSARQAMHLPNLPL